MLLLVPAQPVHQHSSANNAASLTPLMDSVGRLRQCFFVRKTIVVSKNDQNKNTIQKLALQLTIQTSGAQNA